MTTLYLVTYKEDSGYVNSIQYDNIQDLANFLSDCLDKEDKVVITTIQI